jgi:lysophospholipase L1-like esterase
VLLSDKADFRPQSGLYTHTSQGVFGRPVGKPDFHPVIILGDSISPYVNTAASKIGDAAPIMNFGQAGESAERFWRAGEGRQKLFGGLEAMLYQYGVNDMRGKRPFEDLKSDAMNTWKAFQAAGGKHLIVFTSTPLSTSTDKWQTVENQKADFAPDVRARWNDFLRALDEKQTGLKVTVIDTAALLESAPSSSLWKTTPEGKPATDDGCHPNGAGYEWIKKELGEKIRAAIVSRP